MGAIITLSLLAILLLYLGLFKARTALLPVTLAGLALALGFEWYGWDHVAVPQYSGMVLFDRYAIAFSILCIFIAGLVLSLSKAYFKAISENVAEYYSLILFSLVGALLVCSYHNFAILFIGIEVMSVALYILVGIRKRDRASNEAALKYFLMGAFSTGFLLFGITLMYGAAGSFDLGELQLYVRSTPDHQISPLFFGGILLMLVGLCFKIGAAPFHFWTPDVYDGSPILITAYMSTVVKVASFAGFLRLFSMVMVPLDGFWEPVLLTVAIITLFVGNISALVQSSFKRMLAYSSIAHAGYMLFAILSIGTLSPAAILTYGFAYSLASVVAFAALILVKRQIGTDQFESFNGLAKKNPYLAVVLTVAMLSLAGIPLTAGFIGKFMMFGRVMESYHTLLLVLAAVNAVIGVFYYLRVVVHMYFKTSEKEADSSPIQVPMNFQIIFTLSILLTLAVGIYPEWLVNLL